MQSSYLVRSISPNHMQDGLVTPRMEREPCIRLQYLSVEDDDFSAIGDEALDLPPRNDDISSWCHSLALTFCIPYTVEVMNERTHRVNSHWLRIGEERLL
jgi:hypothetical protein